MEELIHKCLNDDAKSWEQFVNRYSRLIWNTIHKTFNLYSFQYSGEDSEEVYSSVFFSLIEDDFRRLKNFRGENASSLTSWLAVLTSRKTIDYIRRDRTRLYVDNVRDDKDIIESFPDEKACITHIIEEKRTAESLKQAVELLSQKDKEMYELIYTRGVALDETAGILGIPLATVYSKKHRIIKKLKKIISDM